MCKFKLGKRCTLDVYGHHDHSQSVNNNSDYDLVIMV